MRPNAFLCKIYKKSSLIRNKDRVSLSRYVLYVKHQNVLGLWGPFKKGIPSGASELKEGYKNRHDDISCKG